MKGSPVLLDPLDMNVAAGSRLVVARSTTGEVSSYVPKPRFHARDYDTPDSWK